MATGHGVVQVMTYAATYQQIVVRIERMRIRAQKIVLSIRRRRVGITLNIAKSSASFTQYLLGFFDSKNSKVSKRKKGMNREALVQYAIGCSPIGIYIIALIDYLLS